MLRLCRRTGLIVLAYSAQLSSARAEVCDKENPLWSRADGPVGPLDPLVAFAVSPTGVVLILLAAIALLIDRRWLAGLAIAAFGAAAIGVAADSLYLDDVHRAAIAEGCRGSPVLVIGALVVGIGLLAVCRLFRR